MIKIGVAQAKFVETSDVYLLHLSCFSGSMLECS
jgi:hypothetical protein